MTQYRAELPRPPAEYDPSFMRQLNARLEEIFNEKLDRFGLPIFGGVPMCSLKGTNTDFVVANNTEVTLPFDTIKIDNPQLVTRPPNPKIDPPFSLIAFLVINLWSKTDQSNKVNTFTLRVYDEGDMTTPLATYVIGMYLAINSAITFNAINLLENNVGPLVFTLQHDANGSITLDMDRSNINFIQMSVNPLLVETIRYGTQPLSGGTPVNGSTQYGDQDSRFSLMRDYDT